MKKAKVLLAGALVLALGLVMGCKGLGSGDENVTKEGNKKLTWSKQGDITTALENTSEENYLRFFQQFGTGSYKINTASFKLDMKYTDGGKTGIVFGLDKNSVGGKDKVSYYVFGIGQKKDSDGQLEYFVDYYESIDVTSITTSSDSEGPTGATSKSVVPMTNISADKFPSYEKNGELTVYIDLTYNEDDQNYKIELGPKSNNLSVEFTTAAHDSIAPSVEPKGRIGAYGMIPPGKKGLNTYEVLKNSPFILAAEEE